MSSNIPMVINAGLVCNSQEWIRTNRVSLEEELNIHGAILLRGFDIRTEQDFMTFVRSVSGNILEYIYRSTPRTDLGSGVYTATEYPAGLSIALHNENAYQRDWPLKIFFYCMDPAERGGGQTPLARTLNVTNRIAPRIRQEFSEKKLMYIRNYRKDIDLPWQTVFQTESKSQVEKYCTEHDIAFEWTSSDNLRTKQVCQAVATHPATGAVVWFNSAHLFHPSGLDKITRDALHQMFQEDEFPRNVRFGDGSTIDEDDLEDVRDAFRDETVTFSWEKGDVLILDNMLISHGRTPYKGKRRVLTAMSDPISSRLASQI